MNCVIAIKDISIHGRFRGKQTKNDILFLYVKMFGSIKVFLVFTWKKPNHNWIADRIYKYKMYFRIESPQETETDVLRSVKMHLFKILPSYNWWNAINSKTFFHNLQTHYKKCNIKCISYFASLRDRSLVVSSMGTSTCLDFFNVMTPPSPR